VDANGSYDYSVGAIAGYVISPETGELVVQGENVTQEVLFLSNASAYPVTFVEVGLPAGTAWSVTLAGVVGRSQTTTLTFREPNGTFDYSVLAVPGYTASSTGIVSVRGQPMAVAVVFHAVELYLLQCTETGLPFGAAWGVTAIDWVTGATVFSDSNSTLLTLSLLNGSYNLSTTAPPGFSVTLSPSQVTVTGFASDSCTATFQPLSSPPETSSWAPPPVWVDLLVGESLVILGCGLIALLVALRRPPRPPMGSRTFENPALR